MWKVWYIALIGRPNTGKSTFLNALIGEKVSIVSSRPQTTQRTIMGIHTHDGGQMIFLDTPWVHESIQEINEYINTQAYKSLNSADVIVRFLDPTRPHGEEEKKIDTVLATLTKPIIRVETKKDLPCGYHHPKIDVHISSSTREWFDALIEKIQPYLPEGEYLYDPEYYTDQDMELRLSEIIREQLFLCLGEEVPYASFVEITEIEDTEWLLRIMAYINTESDSQKYIIIGKGGKKLSEIGMKARMHLEDIFGKKVFLALRVKTLKNWRKNKAILEKLFPKR